MTDETIKLCCKCGPLAGPKPLSEFSPSNRTRPSYCRECARIYATERYRAKAAAKAAVPV